MPTRKLIEATSTPLASIFGSGFLIIVPVLAGAVGPWAVVAMVVVTALAYAVGSVIRFNIRHAEHELRDGTAMPLAVTFERASDLALVGAYVISVSLYVNILAAFLLGGFGIDSALGEHLVTVVVIATIGIVGFTRGLHMLQRLEDWALLATLVIVIALLVGFFAYDRSAFQGSGIVWPQLPQGSWWQIATVVGGTLIVVQGFETSRYLGDEFDVETRIRSCRLSQLISMVVYIVFVASATPLMHFLGDKVEDNALIMLAGKASPLLPVPLVLAAVASQFSAAVADTMAAGGNAAETTRGHVDNRHAYGLLCGGAIVLAFMPTLTILALASRGFALYYLLQCVVAISTSRSTLQRLAIGVVAMILVFITLFAVPAG